MYENCGKRIPAFHLFDVERRRARHEQSNEWVVYRQTSLEHNLFNTYEAEMKWTALRKRHPQTYFLQWNGLRLD